MATRARELLNRSRSLLDRSRVVVASRLLENTEFENTEREPLALTTGTQGPQPQAATPDREAAEALVGICSSIALRDLNLVDSLLAQLEEMEAKEEDQDRLAELYRLDHTATRLRRNAENLRVLAGRDSDDSGAETASLVDVVRAAMSSIDHYSRVTIGRVVSLGVVGFAAEDLSRLLAEVLDNAANQSSPDSPVRVSAHLTEQGSVLLRIEDEGIGLPPDRLSELNHRLSAAPVLDDDSVRHMGLAVVRRLADRHDMRVHLDRRMPHGTTATILLPAGLVCELPEANWSGAQTVVFPQASFGADRQRSAPKVAPKVAPRSGLPHRGANRNTAPADQHAPPLTRRKPSPVPAPASGGTTPGGLPRRVPRSIKGTDPRPAGDTDSDAPSSAEETVGGHDQLLADLDAFSDGEQAARSEQQASTNDVKDTGTTNTDSATPPEEKTP
ncbi:Histidine kinase-, DNA gyrase B-, and HSP90-like ATPase [Amycolatopsis marina]|uniref:histidine kinase n=1 Tax=Amycolatopsis marina TaxID=490629 RepID=A0A1I1CKG2_9PSEU|nr:ATP-binding protein [Amycolatopsis marina]SFB62967.1 Histidine kinase-, DNA gyrase B-, and HSP90-like ATPase [Amycolatopsis marina]